MLVLFVSDSPGAHQSPLPCSPRVYLTVPSSATPSEAWTPFDAAHPLVHLNFPSSRTIFSPQHNLESESSRYRFWSFGSCISCWMRPLEHLRFLTGRTSVQATPRKEFKPSTGCPAEPGAPSDTRNGCLELGLRFVPSRCNPSVDAALILKSSSGTLRFLSNAC